MGRWTDRQAKKQAARLPAPEGQLGQQYSGQANDGCLGKCADMLEGTREVDCLPDTPTAKQIKNKQQALIGLLSRHKPGTLTEGEGSIQLTSSLRQFVQ